MTTILPNLTARVAYSVQLLTDSSKEQDATHRLVKITYKATKERKNPPPNKCVSIPAISLTVEPEVLNDAMTLAYQELQDEMIRAAIEDGAENIYSDQLTPESVAAYSAAKNAPGRLSKDMLEAWYSSDLEEKLIGALACVLKIGENPSKEELAKLNGATEQHKKLIVALASPRAALPANVATNLRKAVMLADGSKVRDSLISKLDAFLQPAAVTLEINL
jgi:hypothetical protein